MLQLLPDHEIHATLVLIQGRGVLLSGPSGVGKSRLALELVQRGHQLVVDDAPRLQRRQDRLYGHCPEDFIGLLHLPEQGLVDVRSSHSAQAARRQCRVELIASLSRGPCSAETSPISIYGLQLPCRQFRVSPEQ
ncbi:MAG: HPr kinase/phosphatase C-terminal domain-containing protein, partial [Gammaproteobacteria bacterium]|nr:HPr kinase/phosphatase C-terminal domain-containing protein [Gammaproteobacteria bacterium]